MAESFSAVTIRKIKRPMSSDGRQARVADYFGSNVFDLRAMAKRLSQHDLETMTRVMKVGGKIDSALSERIAQSVREWAIEKGATHFCHWFQPQTGATAEKHDAFLSFDKQGQPIERFTGPELLQSEPDASSFPSGGIRSTFEARGYTSWDPSSPMFLLETENGKTLYIPSVFISYHGEALDFKTPLLRSNESLSKQAVKTLHFIGENQVKYVTTSVGAEQEFFIIDKNLALKRMDIQFSGRTLFGNRPPKGQEMEDHYFASIPSRVQAFFNEAEVELYKLGVPVKTRHNEVAPGQFEIAPIYEASNIASDHNQLTMKCIKEIALKHGFVVLFHEKPFAGVNGSGKHVNWSMSDSTGRNLLDPGTTPHENIVFLTILCGVLQGISDNADVIRASIASAGNDHRLGANEAPPAIISAFLGQNLDNILNAIEEGSDNKFSAERMMIDLGAAHLQDIVKDNTDRNRTSPFAFTGNKFEFRAVGSSAPINYPVAVLNAAVHDGLLKLNAKLEKRAQKGRVSDNDILLILKEIIKNTKKIRFERNGYSEAWREEALKRGLLNLPDTPAALGVLADNEKTQFLVQAGVFNQADIDSRLAIQQERYIKQRLIEISCALNMVQTHILPVSLSYLETVMGQAKLAKELGVSSPAFKLANSFGEDVSHLHGCLESLKTLYLKITADDLTQHEKLGQSCLVLSEKVLPKLDDLRSIVDKIEWNVPSKLWPFPKYSDLLFGIE